MLGCLSELIELNCLHYWCMMDESKILELLSEYLRKTDRVLDRLDSHDELFEKQLGRIDLAYQVIIGHSEKHDNHKEHFAILEKQIESAHKRTEILQQQTERMEQQTERMEQQTVRLEQQTQILDQHTKEIQEQTKIIHRESKSMMKQLERLSKKVNVLERKR